MTCAEFESRLSAYLDGELSRWKRWKIQNHVQHCPECRETLEDLHTVDLCLVANVAAASAHEYLTAAVLHRIPAMPPAWRRRGSALPWAAGLAVAGMQAAALCGAYWWGFHRGTVTGAPARASAIAGAILPHAGILRPEPEPKRLGSINSSPQPGVWSFRSADTTFGIQAQARPLSSIPNFPANPSANPLSPRPAGPERPRTPLGLQPASVHGGN